MAFYCFHVDVDVPPQTAAERLKPIVRTEQGASGSWKSQDPTSPPFVGTVENNSFRLRPAIRGRNSFLPCVWGRLVPTLTGTRVRVIMFIHPLTTLFMVFWLGMLAHGALTNWAGPRIAIWGMFICGVAFPAGVFFPKAIQARRLLSEAVLDSVANKGRKPALGG